MIIYYYLMALHTAGLAFPYNSWKQSGKADSVETWNSSVCFGKWETLTLGEKLFERCTKNKSKM